MFEPQRGVRVNALLICLAALAASAGPVTPWRGDGPGAQQLGLRACRRAGAGAERAQTGFLLLRRKPALARLRGGARDWGLFADEMRAQVLKFAWQSNMDLLAARLREVRPGVRHARPPCAHVSATCRPPRIPHAQRGPCAQLLDDRAGGAPRAPATPRAAAALAAAEEFVVQAAQREALGVPQARLAPAPLPSSLPLAAPPAPQ
jgi:hypothetical protein